MPGSASFDGLKFAVIVEDEIGLLQFSGWIPIGIHDIDLNELQRHHHFMLK